MKTLVVENSKKSTLVQCEWVVNITHACIRIGKFEENVRIRCRPVWTYPWTIAALTHHLDRVLIRYKQDSSIKYRICLKFKLSRKSLLACLTRIMRLYLRPGVPDLPDGKKSGSKNKTLCNFFWCLWKCEKNYGSDYVRHPTIGGFFNWLVKSNLCSKTYVQKSNIFMNSLNSLYPESRSFSRYFISFDLWMRLFRFFCYKIHTEPCTSNVK